MSWDSKVSNLLSRCRSESAFGSQMVHNPQIGSSQTFLGIWSDTYLEIDPDQGFQVMSDNPSIGVKLDDFDTNPKKGDTITRNSVIYIIRAVEPDGEGGATLVLEKQV